VFDGRIGITAGAGREGVMADRRCSHFVQDQYFDEDADPRCFACMRPLSEHDPIKTTSVVTAEPREPADPPRPFTPEQVGIGYFTTLLSAYITDPTALHAASVEMRDWVARLLRQPPADWQPIATAPKMQTILLFAVTDIAPDGTVRNWRKETGCWMTGYDTDSCRKQNLTPWRWGSDQLKTYQVQPTHWMPLPPSPTEALARPASESASSASNPTTPALPAAPERITPKDKE
jgi:hypothetical protein